MRDQASTTHTPVLPRERAYALAAKARCSLPTLEAAYRDGPTRTKRSAPRERALAALRGAGLIP